MADLRVPVAPLLAAFGLAVTVTRPAPDNTPIPTTGIWLGEAVDQQPYGTELQKRDPRRRLALARVAVPTLPRGTTITAPEVAGQALKTWRVEELSVPLDPEFWVALVIVDASVT